MSIIDRIISWFRVPSAWPSDEYTNLERALVDFEASSEVWEPVGVEARETVPPPVTPASPRSARFNCGATRAGTRSQCRCRIGLPLNRPWWIRLPQRRGCSQHRGSPTVMGSTVWAGRPRQT